MNSYEEAMLCEKSIKDELREIYRNVIKYKKIVRELHQVIDTMYDKDYGTKLALDEKRPATENVFTDLESCKFVTVGDLSNIEIDIRSSVIIQKEGI